MLLTRVTDRRYSVVGEMRDSALGVLRAPTLEPGGYIRFCGDSHSVCVCDAGGLGICWGSL